MATAEEKKGQPSGGVDMSKIGIPIAVAVVGAILAVMFAGQKQQQKVVGDNTANLPATNANVSTNAENIRRNDETHREGLAQNAERARADDKDAARRRSDEINRREKEMVDMVGMLDRKMGERMDRQERFQAEIRRLQERHADLEREWIIRELDLFHTIHKDDVGQVKDLREEVHEHINTPPNQHVQSKPGGKR